MRWPAFEYDIRQRTGQTKSLKTITKEVRFAVPSFIADRVPPSLPSDTREIVETARANLPRENGGTGLGGVMEGLLLRTEAVNSSRIEGKSTSLRRLCLASAGAMSKEWALQTLKNLDCLIQILNSPDQRISMGSLLDDHLIIMSEEDHAGRFREDDEEVHVSEAHDIVEAEYIAPLPERLPELMSDWIAFTNREDIDPVLQIALAHLQFECIHPFCDGNGRTGRAAMQRMLLSADLRPVPVSAALYGIRQRYLEGFDAYAIGDIDYPVRLHAIALWAAAEAVGRHTSERDRVVEKWADKTGSSLPQRRNLRKALDWISHNPAFTSHGLRNGLAGVSEKTAQRLISQLEDHEIISSNKQTHRKENGRRAKIWEAADIYKIGDAVEKTARKLAQDAAPPPYSPDAATRPLPAAMKKSRKQEIADAIAETGAHPLLTLPTSDRYDYGFSAFEFFVLKDGDIQLRTHRENVDLAFTGDDCEEMLVIFSTDPSSTGYFPTEYNSQVPPRSTDKLASKFAALSGCFSGHLGREISVAQELKSHWDWLLSEFADVLKNWYIWRSIGVWNKYMGPRAFSFPTEEYRSMTGRNTAIALFSALDSFLQPEPQNRIKEFKELRGEQWYSGYTPSLHVLIDVTKEASDVNLHGLYDAECLFSGQQLSALNRIEKDLADLKKPNQFWKEFLNHPDYRNADTSNEADLIKELATQQSPNQQMATYITTARNAMAHNREDIYGQSWYINTTGFSEAGEEFMSRRAVDFIAETLRRISTQVFGMKSETLEEFFRNAEREAEIIANKTKESYDDVDFARQQRMQAEKNWHFRLSVTKDIAEHNCYLPHNTPNKILHPGLHLFKHFCRRCGGDMTALGLQGYSPIVAEISNAQNKGLLNGELTEFVIGEGRYGKTSANLKFARESVKNFPSIRSSEMIATSLILKIYWYGDLLLEENCYMLGVPLDTNRKKSADSCSEPFVNWGSSMKIYLERPFCLPVAQYKEILNIQQAMSDAAHQARTPHLTPVSADTGKSLAEEPAEYPDADQVRHPDTNDIVYRFLTSLSQRKQPGSILWMNTPPDFPDIAARETLLEVQSVRTTSTNFCEHLCKAYQPKAS